MNQTNNKTGEENESLVNRWLDEINQKKKDYLDEYYADEYAYHGSGGVELDAEGYKARVRYRLTAFSDGGITSEDVIRAGDKVVTRWKIRATLNGEWEGVTAHGKKVEIEGIIITRFKDGKAVESWEVIDRLDPFQQLGAVPKDLS